MAIARRGNTSSYPSLVRTAGLTWANVHHLGDSDLGDHWSSGTFLVGTFLVLSSDGYSAWGKLRTADQLLPPSCPLPRSPSPTPPLSATHSVLCPAAYTYALRGSQKPSSFSWGPQEMPSLETNARVSPPLQQMHKTLAQFILLLKTAAASGQSLPSMREFHLPRPPPKPGLTFSVTLPSKHTHPVN